MSGVLIRERVNVGTDTQGGATGRQAEIGGVLGWQGKTLLQSPQRGQPCATRISGFRSPDGERRSFCYVKAPVCGAL